MCIIDGVPLQSNINSGVLNHSGVSKLCDPTHKHHRGFLLVLVFPAPTSYWDQMPFLMSTSDIWQFPSLLWNYQAFRQLDSGLCFLQACDHPAVASLVRNHSPSTSWHHRMDDLQNVALSYCSHDLLVLRMWVVGTSVVKWSMLLLWMINIAAWSPGLGSMTAAAWCPRQLWLTANNTEWREKQRSKKNNNRSEQF